MTALQAREKTVDVVRWAAVFLVAIAAWEGARILNAAVHTAGLVRAEAVLGEIGALMHSVEGGPGFSERLTAFLVHHAPLAVSALFLLGVAALAVRMLFAGPLFDHLYLESEGKERRTMLGFLVATLGLLLQLGLIYAMVLFARPAEGGLDASGLVPLAMLAYLAVGAVWMVLMKLGAGKEDARALQGFWYALLTNVAVAAGLGYALWRLNGTGAEEGLQNAAPESRVALTALAALLLCTLDSFFQGRLYGKTHGRNALRTILTLILLLAVLAFGAYILSLTLPATPAPA